MQNLEEDSFCVNLCAFIRLLTHRISCRSEVCHHIWLYPKAQGFLCGGIHSLNKIIAWNRESVLQLSSMLQMWKLGGLKQAADKNVKHQTRDLGGGGGGHRAFPLRKDAVLKPESSWVSHCRNPQGIKPGLLYNVFFFSQSVNSAFPSLMQKKRKSTAWIKSFHQE